MQHTSLKGPPCTCALHTPMLGKGALVSRPAVSRLAARLSKRCWRLLQPGIWASALHRTSASGTAVTGCRAVIGARQQESLQLHGLEAARERAEQCQSDHLPSCASFHPHTVSASALAWRASNACTALSHPLSKRGGLCNTASALCTLAKHCGCSNTPCAAAANTLQSPPAPFDASSSAVSLPCPHACHSLSSSRVAAVLLGLAPGAYRGRSAGGIPRS
jgi:hypothetical protein